MRVLAIRTPLGPDPVPTSSRCYLTHHYPCGLVCLLYQPSRIQSLPHCQNALTSFHFWKPFDNLCYLQAEVQASVCGLAPAFLAEPSATTPCMLCSSNTDTTLPSCFLLLLFRTCIIGSCALNNNIPGHFWTDSKWCYTDNFEIVHKWEFYFQMRLRSIRKSKPAGRRDPFHKVFRTTEIL